jgi:hypothetical protein
MGFVAVAVAVDVGPRAHLPPLQVLGLRRIDDPAYHLSNEGPDPPVSSATHGSGQTAMSFGECQPPKLDPSQFDLPAACSILEMMSWRRSRFSALLLGQPYLNSGIGKSSTSSAEGRST